MRQIRIVGRFAVKYWVDECITRGGRSRFHFRLSGGGRSVRFGGVEKAVKTIIFNLDHQTGGGRFKARGVGNEQLA